MIHLDERVLFLAAEESDDVGIYRVIPLLRLAGNEGNLPQTDSNAGF